MATGTDTSLPGPSGAPATRLYVQLGPARKMERGHAARIWNSD